MDLARPPHHRKIGEVADLIVPRGTGDGAIPREPSISTPPSFPAVWTVARANERAFSLESVPAGWELPFSGACAGLGATSLASERGLVTEARTAGRSCIL